MNRLHGVDHLFRPNPGVDCFSPCCFSWLFSSRDLDCVWVPFEHRSELTLDHSDGYPAAFRVSVCRGFCIAKRHVCHGRRGRRGGGEYRSRRRADIGDFVKTWRHRVCCVEYQMTVCCLVSDAVTFLPCFHSAVST